MVGIRPEQFRDPAARVSRAELARLRASVGLVETLGSELLAHVSLARAAPYQVDFEPQRPDGAEAEEDVAEPIVRRLVVRLDGDSPVQPGDDIELGVQVDQLHWFDPETGAAIGAPAEPEAPSADRRLLPAVGGAG
jgi:multiple sugar transport system ATP-binding protein